jgi:ribosome modulation factor
MNVEAYYDGYWSALDGAGRDANPYEEDPRGRVSWEDGWEDAQCVLRVSER